ncbi:MAG: ATP-binding protein, partial [Deltaproteobacteria bacterium]
QGLLLTWTLQQNPVVMADSLHLKQLWTNLISNAIKYTPAGGTVRVFLDQQEGWALGGVEDSGIGISPQELPLVFHEFYRTAEARKMGVRGTGLGLPLVKRIVEGYGGSLEVQSTVGKGSHFRFRLPIADDSRSGDPVGGQGPPP